MVKKLLMAAGALVTLKFVVDLGVTWLAFYTHARMGIEAEKAAALHQECNTTQQDEFWPSMRGRMGWKPPWGYDAMWYELENVELYDNYEED